MPNDRLAAKERLRALAEEGEHIKETNAAKEQKEREEAAQRKARLEAEEKAAKRETHLREAISHSGDYWLGSMIVCALLVVGLVVVLRPAGEEFLPLIVVGFLIITLGGMLLASISSRIVWRSILRREQRWLASLPFSADGYFELLSQDPSSREISVRISFTEQSPDDELLRGLLARKRVALHNNAQGAANTRSPSIPCSGNFDGDETNHNLHLWMKSFLTEIALPLHEAFPIRAISFR